MLLTSFGAAKPHVKALIRHFQHASEDFQRQQWENSTAKLAKFIEAVLKTLHVLAFRTPAPSQRAFSAGAIIDNLGRQPQGTLDDTVRVLIPRACRFVYDVASNRGGRHDSDEIDANEMDATATMNMCSWILAEMVRFSQHGAVDLSGARNAIIALMAKKYPLVEEVDGCVHFHGSKKSAPNVALVALNQRYPKRISRDVLISMVERNGFSKTNAAQAVDRIGRYVDATPAGLVLLNNGRAKADELLSD